MKKIIRVIGLIVYIYFACWIFSFINRGDWFLPPTFIVLTSLGVTYLMYCLGVFDEKDT